MNNQIICLQIAVPEVEYLKTKYINPVLAEVDMEFYHHLPAVQEHLGEMARLERLVIRLNASNTTTDTTTMTATLAPTVNLVHRQNLKCLYVYHQNLKYFHNVFVNVRYYLYKQNIHETSIFCLILHRSLQSSGTHF